jgi:hypothetical protein
MQTSRLSKVLPAKESAGEQLNYRAEPELVLYGTLPHTEQKARRIIKTYEQGWQLKSRACPGKKRRSSYEW